MFGYVLPSREKLSKEDEQLFRSAYCGLCHCLREEYGFAASLILNYDLTYLAILLSEASMPDMRCRRCVMHPIKGCTAAVSTDALKKAAACSVVLAYWQIRDGVSDSRGLKRIGYRAVERVLRRAYRKAAAACPDFDKSTRRELEKLAELEKENCCTLDEPADAFAELLAGVAAELPSDVQRRVFREIFYHMGRWIYLVDAADDLEKDFKSGNYNPLRGRYGLKEGKLDDASRAEFAATLDQSIRKIAAAFELWNFGCYENILRSTFYEGMYQVGNAVLAGTFRRRRRKKDEMFQEDKL